MKPRSAKNDQPDSVRALYFRKVALIQGSISGEFHPRDHPEYRA